MPTDQTGTQNLNQKQASNRITSETEKQINPSVKFNPRQETAETESQSERGTRATAPHKTTENAPTVDSTVGGI